MTSAYVTLSTERPGGMGIMPIPVSAIWRWCDRKLPGASDEVLEHFEKVIRNTDRLMVEKALARKT